MHACIFDSDSMQVDGAYEDWLELLRLMYYSGKAGPWIRTKTFDIQVLLSLLYILPLLSESFCTIFVGRCRCGPWPSCSLPRNRLPPYPYRPSVRPPDCSPLVHSGCWERFIAPLALLPACDLTIISAPSAGSGPVAGRCRSEALQGAGRKLRRPINILKRGCDEAGPNLAPSGPFGGWSQYRHKIRSSVGYGRAAPQREGQ